MIKKEAKGKTAAKKAEEGRRKKKTRAPRSKKRNPRGVRNGIAKIVESGGRQEDRESGDGPSPDGATRADEVLVREGRDLSAGDGRKSPNRG
jgi:hypothetical protein